MAFGFYILWAAPHVCLAVSLVLLLRRGTYRNLPFFSAYIGFQIVEFLVMLFVSTYASRLSSDPVHFYRSFATANLAISTTLEFLALFELTKELTLPRRLAPKVLPLFRWVAVALILFAAFVSARLLRNGPGQLMSALETLGFSANLVKLGLLLVALLCTKALKISWKSLPAGIALGFGVQSSSEMGASLLYSILGKPGILTVDTIRMAAFLLCTIVWLVFIARPDKPSEFNGKELQVSELELLDQQIERMMRP